jgi:hypothetical protein
MVASIFSAAETSARPDCGTQKRYTDFRYVRKGLAAACGHGGRFLSPRWPWPPRLFGKSQQSRTSVIPEGVRVAHVAAQSVDRLVPAEIHQLEDRRPSGRASDFRALFVGELGGAGVTTFEAALPSVFFALLGWGIFFNFPRRDPHDMNGVADHVGGVLLAFGASFR